MIRTILIPALFAMAISGCATQKLKDTLPPVTPDLSFTEAQSNPEQSIGKWVRWGGTIVQVTNLEAVTEVELVIRPLESDLSPAEGDVSYGRAIARIKAFLDPEVYARGRELTIRGRIAAWRDGKIGDHPYRFPLIEVESYHLWPADSGVRQLPAYWPYGSRYDPFYDPWPFYPPYYRGRFYPW
ncbi:MAG: Slp family lipoprotein [Thiotrichales bacterium]